MKQRFAPVANQLPMLQVRSRQMLEVDLGKCSSHDMFAYRARILDGELQERMKAVGAVLIEGPKACGKTSTAGHVAATIIRFDEDASARAAASAAPGLLFDHPTPILFDEWQVEPKIWNRVRRQVDDQHGTGLYLLTGSPTPRDDVTRHSGAGRFSTLRMRPMSLFESGHSNGEVSLAALFEGSQQQSTGGPVDVPILMERIVVGGWPDLLGATVSDSQRWVRDYLRTAVEVDIPRLGHRRAPGNLTRLMQSLARSVGQAPKLSELRKDVAEASGTVAFEAVCGYLQALERLMLTENSAAWSTHMRSRLRCAPVRYFVDPSIGAAALGVAPRHLLSDLDAAGFHFEALDVRDLRIYCQPLDGQVFSWRDANGHEIDAIVTTLDGRWGAFEVKLNPDDADVAASSLLRFVEKVQTSRTGMPVALGVITSTGMAYRRADGVYIIPIGTLGP